MKKTKILKGILTMAAALVFAVFAYSANAGDNQLKVTDGFDRYKFNSVTAEIWPPKDEYEVGSTVPFKVQITSGNDYPIVNGNVYVKIFKRQGEVINNKEGVNFHETKQIENELENGGYLIDQFNALEDISLDAKGTKTLEFNWQVPKYLPAGEYRIVTFYQSSRKFNLLGLPFTEDVVGNTYDFTIKNSNKEGTVEFDRNNIKVNDEEFDLIGFSKNYPKGEAVKIEAPLRNTTGKSQTVTLNYNLYYWDQLLEQNKIKSEKETVTLSPNETKIVTHNVEGNEYPVNFLEMKADWQDTHSIINIRFTRDAHEKARNNFASLSSFPLVANKSVTLFTTAHAVKQLAPVIPDLMLLKGKDALQDETYTLTLALRDKNKKTLASYTYTGSIGGEVTGYEADFIPKESYNFVTLEASVKDKDGKVIDQTALNFDCEAINPNACIQKDALEAADGKFSTTKTNSKTIMTVLFILLTILVIVYVIYKKKNSSLAVFLLIFCGSLLLGAQGARGELIFNENTSSAGGYDTKVKQAVLSGFLGDRAYKATSAYPVSLYSEYDYFWNSIKEIDATVTYTGASTVDDEAILNIGDTFYIYDQSLTDDSKIYWFVKGWSVDSPPGCWANDLSSAGTGKEKCKRWNMFNEYVTSTENGINYYWYYKLNAYLAFKRPTLSISPSSNVSCVEIPGNTILGTISRWKCTVNSLGTGMATVALSYTGTTGKFSYDSYASTTYVNKDSRYQPREYIDQEFQSKLWCDQYRDDYYYDPPVRFETLIVDDYKGCDDVMYRKPGPGNKMSYGYKNQCWECNGSGAENVLRLPQTTLLWTYQVVSSTAKILDTKITKNNGADGKVNISVPSSSCSESCQKSYTNSETVTLTPEAISSDTTINAVNYDGCTKSGNNYTCAMSSDHAVYFTFTKSGPCVKDGCKCAASTCIGQTCNDCEKTCNGEKACNGWREVAP